jgi:hypothetical protein
MHGKVFACDAARQTSHGNEIFAVRLAYVAARVHCRATNLLAMRHGIAVRRIIVVRIASAV